MPKLLNLENKLNYICDMWYGGIRCQAVIASVLSLWLATSLSSIVLCRSFSLFLYFYSTLASRARSQASFASFCTEISRLRSRRHWSSLSFHSVMWRTLGDIRYRCSGGYFWWEFVLVARIRAAYGSLATPLGIPSSTLKPTIKFEFKGMLQ